MHVQWNKISYKDLHLHLKLYKLKDKENINKNWINIASMRLKYIKSGKEGMKIC